MPHQVVIQPRGFCVQVNDGETILDAVRREGYTVPYSCRQAVCGVCRGKIVSGEIVYADDIILSALSDREAEQGYALFCSAELKSDLVVEWHDVYAPGEIIPRKISATVHSVVAFNADTFHVRLRLPSLDTPHFYAGQYLFIVMPDGERKPFSIASAPSKRPELDLHIRVMEGHAAADAVLKHIQARSVITLEMPFGAAHLRSDERPLLMIAGGTGVAPMLSVIDELIAQHSSRPVSLYWGARDVTQFYCHAELLQRAQQHRALAYHPVLSVPNSAWHGALGFPHQLALQQHPDVSAFDIFIGGSLEMAKAVSQACLSHGARADRIFCDLLDLQKEGI